MKILLASSSSGSRSGGERHLLYLGRALVQRGHELTLWASEHPRMDELANTFASFGEVIRSPHRGHGSLAAYFDCWGACRLSRVWRRAGVDLIHVNKQTLGDGLDLLRAARDSRLASLCTIHFTKSAHRLGLAFARVRDALARRALLAYPGMLVTVLASRRRELLDFLETTPKVRLVPNGVPLFDLSQREGVRMGKRAELGVKPRELLFLGIGRMAKTNRPMLFLEEAEKIIRAVPAAQFLWIGEGNLAGEWDAWVAARGLEKAIRRLPWQMDIVPLLFAADLFLHVAEFDGVPLALLEALSAGLPCALTPNLLAEMPFLNAENALVIDDAGAWLAAARDPARRLELRKFGRKLIETEFSFAQMAEQYEVLYQVAKRNDA